MFKVGEKVVYPNHGVGLVEQVSVGAMNGRTENCYLLRIASSGLKVMVPESNIKCVGLRRTVRSSEIVEIVAYLERGKCSNHHDWKFRFKQNSEKMRTGSLLSVAEVLKSLVVLSKGKPLSFREKKMLDRAKYLLVSELATVRNVTEQTVEASLHQALAKSHLHLP
ncbi:MAG TPA: CarD family transcriptional regulator [Candidatus Acidoferrales bacterium]|jgi:CarD family transcriptional regulator